MWSPSGLLIGVIWIPCSFALENDYHAKAVDRRQTACLLPLFSNEGDGALTQAGRESRRNRKAVWTAIVLVSVAVVRSVPVIVVSIMQIVTNDLCRRRHPLNELGDGSFDLRDANSRTQRRLQTNTLWHKAIEAAGVTLLLRRIIEPGFRL